MYTTMLVFNQSNCSTEVLTKGVLSASCYDEVLVVACGEALLQAVANNSFEMVLMVISNLAREHVHLVQQVQQAEPCPMIIFADEAAPELLMKLVNLNVSVVIQGGFEASRLPVLCAIAKTRFEGHQKLHGELEEALSRLADRKLIDRAKGLLMSQRQINEPEAYALLRKQAMDKGLRLGVVAGQLIDTLEMLEIQADKQTGNQQKQTA